MISGAMQAAMEGIIRAAMGPEGPAKIQGLMDKLAGYAGGIDANLKAIREQNEKILLQQDDIQTQIGRINKELRIPPPEPSEAGTTLQS